MKEKRESDAFECIYRTHYPAVFRTLRNRTRNQDDAEDLAQIAANVFKTHIRFEVFRREIPHSADFLPSLKQPMSAIS